MRHYEIEQNEENFEAQIKKWFNDAIGKSGKVVHIWFEGYDVDWTGRGELKIGFQLTPKNNSNKNG